MALTLTTVIDNYCMGKYNHTNWDWVEELPMEPNERADAIDDMTTNEAGHDIADIEGNIIFYYDKEEE